MNTCRLEIGLGENTVRAFLALCVLLSVESADSATSTWTGTEPDGLWSTADNWQPSGVPGVNDIALFGQMGSGLLPGDVTNALDAAHVVESLRYSVGGAYHTTNLQGHVLSVAGSFDVNFDRMASTIATIENGVIQIGTAETPADVSIARRLNPGDAFFAELDLSGLASLEAHLDELLLGMAASGVSVGTLQLPPNNYLSAESIILGRATESTTSLGVNTILLGQENTIVAGELVVGDRFASGLIDGPFGGSVEFGTAEIPAEVIVGRLDALASDNTSGIVNFGGMALNAHLTNLIVGERSQGGQGMLVGRFIGGSSGEIVIGAGDSASQLVVSRTTQGGRSYGNVDLGGIDLLTANVDQIIVGSAANSGEAEGVVRLAHENHISAVSVIVGDGEDALGQLRFGDVNQILATDFLVGVHLPDERSEVAIVSGGRLVLGSEETPTNLTVAHGSMDLTAAEFSGRLSNLSVAGNSPGASAIIGSVEGAASGSLQIGSPSQLGNLVVASGRAEGVLDLSGMESLTAYLNEFLVGVATSEVPIHGEVLLPRASMIEANRIVVAQGGDENVSTLRLGPTATLLADEILVGVNKSEGLLEAVSGGTVLIGAPERPTRLVVARGTTDVGGDFFGTADFSGTELNAWLSDLIVGQKNDASGIQIGVLQGGSAGDITVGSPENRGLVAVGDTRAIGNANLATMNRIEAYVDQMLIGVTEGGRAEGNFRLPDSSWIDAHSIVIGADPSRPTSFAQDGTTTGTLLLGRNATILADELVVARDYGDGTIRASAGSDVQLGSPERPVRLAVSRGTTDANEYHFGTADFRGGELNAWLSDIIVGQKNDGSGQQNGEFYGGNAGEMFVGGPENRGAIAIGNTRSVGHVDLASMDRMEAYVNQMLIGVASGRFAAGDFHLPRTSVIDALSIVIGSDPSIRTSHAFDGESSGELALGADTTILADQIVVGRDYGNGVVRAPVGSRVQLGDEDSRVNLEIGTGVTNTNDSFFGHVDLSGAVVTAWLGDVVLGQKNLQPGQVLAELLFGMDPDNVIDAESILIGGNQSQGRLRFGGGTLRADSIQRGAGEAIFEWTGGTLEIGQFGSLAVPYDMQNDHGVLAPGASIGVATIFGSYLQEEGGALLVEVGGSSLGFDHDQLVVEGMATLGGSLDVVLIDDEPFNPTAGQSFEILTAAQGIQGMFTDEQLPGLPAGLAWEVNYLPNALILDIVQRLRADFNMDGDVDEEDLSVWETGFGVSDVADADGDGDSDGADLLVWQAEFGLSTSAASAIPEPTSSALGLLAILIALWRAPLIARRLPNSYVRINALSNVFA